jgi:hypothetical protein
VGTDHQSLRYVTPKTVSKHSTTDRSIPISTSGGVAGGAGLWEC